MKDKMPTLHKIKRAAMPPANQHKLLHILFCPTHKDIEKI